VKVEEKAIEILKDPICDNCLGRSWAGLLSGYSNEERGKIIRSFIAFLLDSGEKIDVYINNFYGFKFRNLKVTLQKPEKCKICKNFFREKLEEKSNEIIKKLKGIEFDTFQLGTIPSDEMANEEEKLVDEIGGDFTEPIKTEINREIGKIIEKKTSKTFSSKNPDVTIILDLQNNRIKTEVRSLYIFGKYQKLKRGIPQTKWVCPNCNGKGCIKCKGIGKLYKTSVQEEIEKNFLKAAESKKSKFHGAGREDIDARNLDWRPFVIELVKPNKRKIDLKKIEKISNKSKKVKIKNLKIADKDLVNEIKFAKIDKTYEAEVLFTKDIDKKKLKELKKLNKTVIMQQTPTRVVHRRANIIRKRMLKQISWKLVSKKKIVFKIRGESGLYIKELITGDEGRTKPNISEILGNKVKKISLDVIKIHAKGI
jgi:tRNA pseudouridine synthase 10